ncbi:VWA domain-containing protein [Rubritalea spongiae]|uniref:VWA domain-containing protein n=1 Tax=Rubritalea spongiae TaxID=430797 RepID=A0ABW5E592_9BACT
MNEFTFQQPTVLLLALLLIPLSWLLYRAREKRRSVINALGITYSTHRKLRDILRLVSLLLIVCALAKPGHSPETKSVSNTGRDVVFALDVSRSMLAEDVIPSRLEVAKQGIKDALETLNSERVGLVAYAGSASILCPLTYDHDFVAHMLEQAHPRSVDFGGTTLQSAVEKIADQVFLADRENVQDLIILTDGGDHGSHMEKVAGILEEKQANALIVGIGDPNQGSPIPITNKEGKAEDLTIDGQTIFTKLDDASLTAFAQQSNRAEYFPVATAPFNLGQLYIDYAQDKKKVASDDKTGFTLYQDASLYFLAPALLLLLLSECWGLKGLQLGNAVVFFIFLTPLDLDAAETYAQKEFSSATTLMRDGYYEEAAEKLQELPTQLNDQQAAHTVIAASSFNLGLCYHELSQSHFENSPETAHSYAQQAQRAFLTAKRYDQSFKRAGQRIVSTAQWIAELDKVLKAQQEAEEAIEKEIQALLEELNKILTAQQEIRESVRISERQHKQHTSPEVTVLSKEFSTSQSSLTVRSSNARSSMLSIHEKLEIPGSEQDSLMTQPLKYMSQVVSSQQHASEHLIDRANWSAALSQQSNAEKLLTEIIELLSGNSQQSSDEDGEEGDDEGEEDYEYSEDDSESSMSSESMQGDFSSTSQMQSLPEPNYSAEDILQEEQSNLQFRQEKRASQNAAQVEKDY